MKLDKLYHLLLHVSCTKYQKWTADRSKNDLGQCCRLSKNIVEQNYYDDVERITLYDHNNHDVKRKY